VAEPDDEDLVPASVRLGAAVPPEDPEDWRRPLTWLAALGMLAAPIVAGAWFVVAPPPASSEPAAGTWLVAGVLVLGAALTGSTQIGPARAFAGTLGAALFAALVTVIVGVALAGQRQVGVASPSVAHAFLAAAAGLAGALAASTVAPVLSGMRSRPRRIAVPAAIGLAVAALALRILFDL
jgi:hypothetical protein